MLLGLQGGTPTHPRCAQDNPQQFSFVSVLSLISLRRDFHFGVIWSPSWVPEGGRNFALDGSQMTQSTYNGPRRPQAHPRRTEVASIPPLRTWIRGFRYWIACVVFLFSCAACTEANCRPQRMCKCIRGWIWEGISK